MTDEQKQEEPQERRCPVCGGPYDQAPADTYIPVCIACQRNASHKPPSTPTDDEAKLTR